MTNTPSMITLGIVYEDGLWIITNGMTQGVNRDFTKALIDFALRLEDYYETLLVDAESNAPLSERLRQHLQQLRPLYGRED